MTLSKRMKAMYITYEMGQLILLLNNEMEQI